MGAKHLTCIVRITLLLGEYVDEHCYRYDDVVTTCDTALQPLMTPQGIPNHHLLSRRTEIVPCVVVRIT
jgi:hypothetical protein